MTTILFINAISSLLAGLGVGGLFAWQSRQARHKAAVQPLYITTGAAGPRPRR